mmetsp:Transcript_36053/g.79257  ORF Transcript_36053/g.79257 Transcript_36053/m.79257 type:complete len:119 (-) Transcript_36053:336-692(-)
MFSLNAIKHSSRSVLSSALTTPFTHSLQPACIDGIRKSASTPANLMLFWHDLSLRPLHVAWHLLSALAAYYSGVACLCSHVHRSSVSRRATHDLNWRLFPFDRIASVSVQRDAKPRSE